MENIKSIIFLYHTEDTGTGGALSAASAVPMLDQFLYMFGEGTLQCIHPNDADYGKSSAISYDTLEDAQAAYPDHDWIYLDANAELHVSEYQHPENNVVYVAGHDATGYGNSEIEQTIKVMDVEGFAIPCLIAVAADRWSRKWQ